MSTEPTTTALTVTQRAQVALKASDHEPQLMALAAKHRDITAITNADGLKQVHAARMELKKARLAIESSAEAAREDANAFSRACVAEQKRLIGIVKPEEERLLLLQEAYEERIAAEKKAREEAERKRLDMLHIRIADIRHYAIDIAECTAAEIDAQLRDLVTVEIGEDFQELRGTANVAKQETLDRLRVLHAKAVDRERIAAELKAAQEAEAKRLADLAAELAAKQAEQAKRDAEERECLAAERAKFEAEQAAARAAQVEAEAKAAAERLAREAEQRRIDQERAEAVEKERQAENAARLQRMRIEAEERAERERIAAVEADRVRQQQEVEAERIRRELEHLEQAKAEQERIARQREIDSATLYDAAIEAHGLLTRLAPTSVTTAKLGAALSRHAEPEALKVAA